MRYERVKVTRDQNTVHSREVAPWEIPVLEFIFGDGNVVRTGDFVTVTPGKLINHEYPEAITELNRMVEVYGHDPKSGVPYANFAYGNGNAGLKAVQKLIDEAKADDEAVVNEAPVPTSTRKRGRPAKAAESLLG